MENLAFKEIVRPKKVFSRIGLALFVYMIAVNLVSVATTLLASRYFPQFFKTSYFTFLNIVFCQYIIGFPIFFLIVKGLPKYSYEKEKLTFKDYFFALCIGYVANYIGSSVGSVVEEVLKQLKGAEVTDNVSKLINESSFLPCLLVVGIIGPVIEELMFRKLIIDRTRIYSERISIIFSGVVFGLFHGNFSQLFYTTLIGMFWAYIYLRSKDIKFSIILHCLNNTISVLLTFGLKLFENISIFGNTEIDETFAQLISSLPIMGFMVLGIITLIRSRKRFFVFENYYKIKKGKGFDEVCLNVGMILFGIMTLVEFTLSIIL